MQIQVTAMLHGTILIIRDINKRTYKQAEQTYKQANKHTSKQTHIWRGIWCRNPAWQTLNLDCLCVCLLVCVFACLYVCLLSCMFVLLAWMFWNGMLDIMITAMRLLNNKQHFFGTKCHQTWSTTDLAISLCHAYLPLSTSVNNIYVFCLLSCLAMLHPRASSNVLHTTALPWHACIANACAWEGCSNVASSTIIILTERRHRRNVITFCSQASSVAPKLQICDPRAPLGRGTPKKKIRV